MAGPDDVTIEFSRTGGFAAIPGLQIRGTATLADAQTIVESGDGYRREIPNDEKASLLSAALSALEQGDALTSASNDQARDAYQYRVTVRSGSRTTTFVATSGSPAPTPAAETIVEWVEKECAAILRSRQK